MENVASLSRNAASALVDREERRTGSRMLAYEAVAQTVGSSAEWIRKFVNKTEGKEPKLTLGFRILTLYSQVCGRVELAAENELMLRREIDAALESFGLLVEAKETKDSGAKQIASSNSGEMK